MKIYTKNGDGGFTSLVFGLKVRKDDLRLDAYGTVDECNAWLGKISTEIDDVQVQNFLNLIQNELFVIGSNLASEKESSFIPVFNNAITTAIEHEIDTMQNTLPALQHFILPGGSGLVANIHIARTVCRRTERAVVKMSEFFEVKPEIVQFLNRLSDYLFVLSRKVALDTHVEEIIWKAPKAQ